MGRQVGTAGEDGKIHAGGEMLAGGRNDDDAGQSAGVNLLDDFGQLAPKGPVHTVELVRPVEAEVGDVVLDLDGKAFIDLADGLGGGLAAHGLSFQSCVAAFPPL